VTVSPCRSNLVRCCRCCTGSCSLGTSAECPSSTSLLCTTAWQQWAVSHCCRLGMRFVLQLKCSVAVAAAVRHDELTHAAERSRSLVLTLDKIFARSGSDRSGAM
jgi:hypothetical protein